jgi:small-conductance mechanosensitive channel
MDFLMSKVLDETEQRQKKSDQQREFKTSKVSSPSRTIQTGVIIIAIIFILKNFNWDVELLTFQDGKIALHISDFLLAFLIFIFARLIAWLITQVAMHPYYKQKQVDIGTQYAVNQLLTYVIFVIAFFVAIESLGVQFAWLWGGAAALLVGVGLGLQQTFNDLTSGIILLFERSIEVGNVVDLDGTVGIVRKIGLRTSQVETRDNIIIIVPNSMLITDQVVNWSHFDDKARFKVTVGVAYGSDIDKVKDILLRVAKENAFVLEHPSPSVFFAGFGDSSLNFQLYFWSRNFMFIERVKSDIRFEIDRVFRKNDVKIPFPQRDLWFRNYSAEEE